MEIGKDHQDAPIYDTPQSNISIFFHTFSRSGANNTQNAFDIVSSLLKMINKQPLLANSTIYYSRFGNLDWEWPLEECKGTRRKCVEFASRPQGNELLTLQQLFEHCLGNQTDRVLYIHSKGTFTPTESNSCLRQVVMEGITSNDCLQYGEANDQCNTCSAQFHVHPTHFTGNMWVSDCYYVSKLIPPKDFISAKDSL